MSGDYIIKLVALVACLVIAVPLVDQLAHALLIPAVIGVVLYLIVRVVNARLDRW
jgi:hypothetical protein